MFAQFGAKRPAVHAVRCGFYQLKLHRIGGLVVAAALGGCLQTAPPLAAADPADPNAKVVGSAYRSTTAPYTPVRPTQPAAWGGQNSPAPTPKTDR